MLSNMAALVRLKATLLCLVLVTASLAFGQTFDNPDAEADSIESDVSAEVGTETEQELEEIVVDVIDIEQGNFDSFVPSEDISEDYSVPFPVDI